MDRAWIWDTGLAAFSSWQGVSQLPARLMGSLHGDPWKVVGISALILLALTGLAAIWLVRAAMKRGQAAVAAARAQAREEADRNLGEVQQRFHKAVSANVNGLLVVDMDGNIIMANPALEHMFGYGEGELLGQQLETLLPERARLQHLAERTVYLREPTARAMGSGRDLRGRRKDGSVFPVEVSLSPFTANGKQYVDAIVADISQRKRIEKMHQKNEARLQLLWETSPNGLLVVDDKGRIQMVNPALERMFGYAPDELRNQLVECLIAEDLRFLHTKNRMHYMQEPRVRPMGAGLNLQGRRKDGSTFPIEVSLASFTEDGQRLAQATVIDMSGWKIHSRIAGAQSSAIT